MRKSKQLRLSQAEDILTQFEAAGIGECRDARFVRDMVSKLRSDRYPTKRQRDWLDSIIDKGLPEVNSEYADLANAIADALTIDNLDFADTLRDFRFKIQCGYNLSEKQIVFCKKLIEKATSIREGNHWQPSEETLQKLKLAVQVSVCYTQHYWYDRPGLSAALESARQYIDGRVAYVDEYRVNRLIEKMTPKIRLLENPKFMIGDFCYVGVSNAAGIIVAGPYVGERSIVYDVLCEGELLKMSAPKKRRS